MARQGDGVATALAPVRRIRYWASQLDEARRARIDAQLARASEQRCHWAGLPLDRPLIMGIVNVDARQLLPRQPARPQAAIALGRAMLEAGADILDIGGGIDPARRRRGFRRRRDAPPRAGGARASPIAAPWSRSIRATRT